MARFSLRRPGAEQPDDTDLSGSGLSGSGLRDVRNERDADEVRPARAEVVDDGLKPSAMRRPEPLYGYVVALELLVVSILNLTITKGKGAPAHPNTGLAVAGVAAAIGLAAIIFRFKHRTVVGFAAIAAAFVVNLSRGPNSLAVAHVFALVFPFAYAFIITQRQRKLMTAQLKAARAGGGAGSRSGGRAGGAGSRRSAGAGSGRRRGSAPAPKPSGPRPNARYTPPKPKRQKPAGR